MASFNSTQAENNVTGVSDQCKDETNYVVPRQGIPSPDFQVVIVNTRFFKTAKNSGSLQPFVLKDDDFQCTWVAITKKVKEKHSRQAKDARINHLDRSSWVEIIMQAVEATRSPSSVDRMIAASSQEFDECIASWIENIDQPRSETEITDPDADELCLFAIRMAMTLPKEFEDKFSTDEKQQWALAISPMTTCWIACVDAMGPLFTLGRSPLFATFTSDEMPCIVSTSISSGTRAGLTLLGSASPPPEAPPLSTKSTSSGASNSRCTGTALPGSLPPTPGIIGATLLPSSSSDASTAIHGWVPPPDIISAILSPRSSSGAGGAGSHQDSGRMPFFVMGIWHVTPYWVNTGKALLSTSRRRPFQKGLDSKLSSDAELLLLESMKETMTSANSITPKHWANAFQRACDGGVSDMFDETLRELALSMTQTRPSSFQDEFERSKLGDDDEKGKLLDTLATRQWVGARLLFGSPWQSDIHKTQGSHEGAYLFNANKDPTKCWVEAWDRERKLLADGQSVFDPGSNTKDNEDSQRLHTIMTGIYTDPTAKAYRDVFQDVLKPEPEFDDAGKYLQLAKGLAIRMALTPPWFFKEQFCQNSEGRSMCSLNPSVHTMQWMGAHEAFGCPWRCPGYPALRESQGESLPPPDKPKLPISPNTPQINFATVEEVPTFLESNHLLVTSNGTCTTTWAAAKAFHPAHVYGPFIFDVNRSGDRHLASRMGHAFREKLKFPSSEQEGHTVKAWIELFHALFDNSDNVSDKYPYLTRSDFHDMKVLAVSMANTPPSLFPRFFTQTSQDLDGYLIRTGLTEQWMAAKEVFGTPWFTPYKSQSSIEVNHGLSWVPVSIAKSGTTNTWKACRDLTECKDLVEFTRDELFYSDAQMPLRIAVAREGLFEQDDYGIGNWLYAFETALLEGQKFLSEKEGKLLRDFACRLALTPPWLFDDFFVSCPTDAEQRGFLAYVTQPPSIPWLAARALFGCPWNLATRPERSLEILPSASAAESVLGGLQNNEADDGDIQQLNEDNREVQTCDKFEATLTDLKKNYNVVHSKKSEKNDEQEKKVELDDRDDDSGKLSERDSYKTIGDTCGQFMSPQPSGSSTGNRKSLRKLPLSGSRRDNRGSSRKLPVSRKISTKTSDSEARGRTPSNERPNPECRGRIPNNRPNLASIIQKYSLETVRRNWGAVKSSQRPPLRTLCGKQGHRYTKPGARWVHVQRQKLDVLGKLLEYLEGENKIIAPRTAWKSDMAKILKATRFQDRRNVKTFICLLSSILLVKKDSW
jgi:hypothetical protein